MRFAMNTTPLDQQDGTKWPVLNQVIDKMLDAGNGEVTLVKPDGRVISCQPGGFIQDRDPGTNNVYEHAVVEGNVVTFRPDTLDRAYQYAFGKVPN